MNTLPVLAEIEHSAPYPAEQVLGLLSRRDFAWARQRAPGFAQWDNHRDFVAERDALYVGYGACGVGARYQRVPFGAFESFTRLTGAPVDVHGLDEFAAHWRFRAQRPNAQVSGRFGFPGDPERNVVGAADVQCVTIRPEVYVRWRDDFAKVKLLQAPGVDLYAAYVVELCLLPEARSR